MKIVSIENQLMYVELDEDVIRAHPYSPHDYAPMYYPNGSVADI